MSGKRSKAETEQTSSSVQTPALRIWLVCIGLAAATLAIYAQVVTFEFVTWDDPTYIYENPHIAQGLTMASVKWAFTSGYASNWHPLTWISHMVDVQLFGLQHPGGHHLVSVLMHVGNVLLLLWLLTRMTGAFWPSALAAALFAFHPLRVESVAWVSERKDVLSGLFFMLTLLTYHGYTQRPTLRRYLLVFLALALGLMSKPMLVTVPFVLLLLDLWPLRRWELPAWPSQRIVLEKLPLLTLVLASCLATASAQQSAAAELDGLPLIWRLINSPVAYVLYLFKTIWPTNLAFFYPHPGTILEEELGHWLALAIGAALLLLLVSVLVLCKARKRPDLLVAWLWFLGMLLPVIGLIQVGQQAWADRYAYLPLLGIYLAFSYSLARWLEHRPAVRQTAIPVVVAALLLLLPLSWRQARVWRNSESLYTHALAVTDNNAVAHDNLGNVYLRQGQSGKALEHYQQALRIEPRDAQTFINMGDALQLMGHTEKAIKYYQQSLRIDGNNAQTYSNLGLALNALGQLQEAAWHCREALRLKPDYAEAYNNLGVVDVSMGNLTNALKHFEMAVRLDPTYTAARENFVAVRERLNEEWF